MIYNESKFNTEWDTLPLSKLGEFKRGKSKHRPRNDQRLFEGGTYPLIQTGEIKAANLLIKSHNATYNEVGLKQSKIWPAGTLAITIAANIAETGILAYPMCFPDSCVGFIANKEKTTELFMHYIFTYIKRSIQNSTVGSIQDNINIEMLTALNFKIPKKPKQDLIVDLLSAIDYKIELNNDINTELENLAKTIYNYWFVQFDFPNEEDKPYKTIGGEMEWNEELKREIPKGWKVKSISDIESNIVTGKTPPTEIDKYYNGLIPFITIPDMRDNLFVFKTEKTLSVTGGDLQKGKYLPENSLCVSCIASPGILSFTTTKSQCNQQMNSIIFKKNENRYLLYFAIKHFFKFSNGAKIGNTFVNMNKEEFSVIKILLPDQITLTQFHKRVNPFFETIKIRLEENQELIKLRDFLLPMLMNGQVKVKSEAKEQLSMAAESHVKYEK